MRRRIASAFGFIGRVMEHPDRYPNRAVVFLLQPQEVASVVTSNRLRLLRALQRDRSASVADLARTLRRDASRVREDLLLLQRLNLVQISGAGNRMRVRAATDGIYISLVSPRKARPGLS